MKYTPYLLLFAILPLLAATCKNNTVLPNEASTVTTPCEEIKDVIVDKWKYNEHGEYWPTYPYYCDSDFAKILEQAFTDNALCKENMTLDVLKKILGEPDTITPGIDGIFTLYGEQLYTIIDNDKAYHTAFYECVTEGKIGGYPEGFCPNQTRKMYFLFEDLTGRLAITNLHMKGTTGWLKPNGK